MTSKHRSITRARLATTPLAALLALTLTAGAVWGAPAGFKMYTSSSQHYKMLYPASWSVKAAAGAMTSFSPRGSGGDGTGVLVLGYHWGSALNSLGGLDGVATTAMRKQRQSGWKLSSEIKTHVAGVDAREWTGTKTSSRNAWAMFIARGTLWTLTLGSPASGYARASSQFKTMVASFTFTS